MTLRPEVQWFAEQMEAALRRNDHKTGWQKCERGWLEERLVEEENELFTALQNNYLPSEIIAEAADVANFAMMIADNTNKKEMIANDA